MRLGRLAACSVLRFRDSDSPGNHRVVPVFDVPHRLHRQHLAMVPSAWRGLGQLVASLGRIKIHHFIGKDVPDFHTLFWPGNAQTAGYSLPTQVHIHGFLNVAGAKTSKSKGTFVKASFESSRSVLSTLLLCQQVGVLAWTIWI